MGDLPLVLDGAADRDRLLAILDRLIEIETVDLVSALSEVCGVLSAALGADKACAFLFEPATNALVAIGISDTPMGRREKAIGMDRLPLANGGSTVEVYTTGEPRLELHADRDPLELLGFTRGLGVRSIVQTPLEIANQRQGVLAAMSASEKKFNTADLHFLTAVARWVGVIVHRTELSEAVVKAAAESVRRAATEQSLAYQAFHDPLTGLPNRALFMDRFGQAVAHASRHERLLAVLFLDIDRFKQINDGLGHDAGDQMLVETARRIKAYVRPEDTVARLGGDEFVILLDTVQDEADAVHVAERLLAEMGRPFEIDGRLIASGTSIGIAVGASGRERSTDLLRNADIAMYRAKEMGGGRFEVYDRSVGVRVSRRFELEQEMHRALGQHEFALFYQPKVDLSTGEIVGVEALVRWRHPSHGLLAPDEFLGLAEDSGFIVPLGGWVLKQACLQARQWRDAGGLTVPPFVCVNISPRQLLQSGYLVRKVGEVLRETGLPGRLLRLEVTEGTLLENQERVRSTLDGLRERGVGIAMDDFGTGYSSLSYLKHFPVDLLKVDREFVRGLGVDADSGALVGAVVALGVALGKQVQAEGIETLDQLIALRRLGCTVGQGFYFDQPLPAEEVGAVLRRGRYDLPADRGFGREHGDAQAVSGTGHSGGLPY